MSIKLNSLLKKKLVQAEALEEGKNAPFHISVRSRDLRRDCHYMQWKKFRKSLEFSGEHPECSHPHHIKEYATKGCMLLDCHDCPFFSGDE